MSTKIEVKGLYKIFGDNPNRGFDLLAKGLSKQEIQDKAGLAVGLDDVSFSVETGEVFVVMGLSGSGKSTLIRCLNRLIKPTKGQVIIDGEDITRLSSQALIEVRRKKISMVFQNFALFPHRTVLENAAFGLEIQGVGSERFDLAREALHMVGLKGWEDNYPGQLSGGMQQRVGLARALANDPDILLMDEAFSALDPLIRKQMQNELLDLQERLHKTIVFITHDLDEALKLGDRILLMKDGRVQQIGTPEEILGQPANEYVRKFVEDVDRTTVLTAKDVMRNPDPVISPKDGPRVALRRMKEEGISSIFVLGKERKLMGLIKAEDAVNAINEGRTGLDGLIITDVPTVQPDLSVADLIPMVATAKYPVSVVDENGRMMGIIIRGSLLATLAGKGDFQ